MRFWCGFCGRLGNVPVFITWGCNHFFAHFGVEIKVIVAFEAAKRAFLDYALLGGVIDGWNVVFFAKLFNVFVAKGAAIDEDFALISE